MSIQPTAGQTFSTPRESRAAPSLWDPLHHHFYYVEAVDKLGVMELPSAAKDLAGPVWPWSTASRNGRTGIPQRNSRTPPRAHSRFEGIGGRPRRAQPAK